MVAQFLLGTFLPAAMAVAVGTSNTQSDFVNVFLQYGAIGAIALAGLWFAYNSNKREQKRADKYENELSELHREVREKVIPALTASTQTNAEVAQTLRDLLRDRRPL